MKKIVSIFIAVCMLLSFAGCRNIGDLSSNSEFTELSPSQSNAKKTVSLLYSYSDSFNPYTATTSANREISSLLYDSLIKTDNNFEPIYVLAQTAETVDKTCTVKLRDATFTDGSTVTADDVVYAYNTAKASARYTHNFYEVVSVSAADSKTVVFKLSQNDPYFTNLLDFPIIKSGTSGAMDADGKEISPIGCGRYYIAEDGLSFKLNENYYGKKGSIEVINLINSPDAASTTHYVEVGATAVYYTEGDNIVRMSGKKIEVNLNRLIYIGVNDSYGSLQSKEMRYAISSALDREAICNTAYYNNAVSATGFFNPYFKATQALQTIESQPNYKITVENLSKIGYNNMNSNGYYANSSGNNPVFTLLVNSENSSRVAAAKAIAAQCKAAGIQINVIECSYEQYVERLTNGNFQLYLGEIQVLDNMDFTNLVVSGGSAAYGVGLHKKDADTSTDADAAENKDPQKSSCEQILAAYHSGACGISDVAATLLTEMPQIPVCYLNGVLFYDSAIIGGVEVSSSDVYLSFENYEF
ncbi:MAG: ABC transporter substrate-binding protein [Clostridia bacterium]|nr:ABC transporter substrate-binding protein [Clostridia bacterium]